MTDQQQRSLVAGLKALAAQNLQAGASPRVEAAVLARMRQRRAAASQSLPVIQHRWSPVGLAAAAALLIVTASGVWLAHGVPEATASIRPAGFVPLPNASALPPIESASIVRVSLPVSALPQYGIPISGDIASREVDVELLIAQDGVARAVRLADDSNLSRSTP